MFQKTPLAHKLRDHRFLIGAVLGPGLFGFAELPRGDIGKPQRVPAGQRIGPVGDATPEEQLLQVTAPISGAILNIALKTEAALGEIFVEGEHVPAAGLILIYFCCEGSCRPQSD